MNKNNIDWEELCKDILWRLTVAHKNEYSGYDIVTEVIPFWLKNASEEEIYPRGNKPGDIVRDTRFLSYSIGPVKKMSWKDLAIELGLGEEFGLFFDGHDCYQCPGNSICNAYFKYDKDHEQCNWWKEHMNDNE